jgi:hypothetical protein
MKCDGGWMVLLAMGVPSAAAQEDGAKFVSSQAYFHHVVAEVAAAQGREREARRNTALARVYDEGSPYLRAALVGRELARGRSDRARALGAPDAPALELGLAMAEARWADALGAAGRALRRDGPSAAWIEATLVLHDADAARRRGVHRLWRRAVDDGIPAPVRTRFVDRVADRAPPSLARRWVGGLALGTRLPVEVRALQRAGEWAAAAAAARRAVRAHPGDPVALRLAIEAAGALQADDVEVWRRDWASAWPDDRDDLARALIAAGRPDLGSELGLTAAVRLRLRLARGRLERVRRQLLAWNDAPVELRKEGAEALLRAGRPRAAEQVAPLGVAGAALRARAAWMRGRPEEGKRRLRAAEAELQAQPELAPSEELRADLHGAWRVVAGPPEAAPVSDRSWLRTAAARAWPPSVERWKAVAERVPRTPTAAEDLAVLALAESSSGWASRALAADPHHPLALRAWLEQHAPTDEALAVAAYAVRRWPDDLGLRRAQIDLLRRAGRGIAAAERALEARRRRLEAAGWLWLEAPR